MGNEAVFFETDATAFEVEAAFEPEAYEGFGKVAAEVETSLNEEDTVALEEGIASVFDELRAEVETADEIELTDEEEPTWALLDELNRIWAQPLAA